MKRLEGHDENPLKLSYYKLSLFKKREIGISEWNVLENLQKFQNFMIKTPENFPHHHHLEQNQLKFIQKVYYSWNSILQAVLKPNTQTIKYKILH